MPSIKECPKEVMTQSSGYVRLPLMSNVALEDERTFPFPISQALIENLPEDINKEICYSAGPGESSYSDRFEDAFGGMKSYYIKIEKYGECQNAISAAVKTFMGSLNNNRPLLEMDSKYFGLTDDAVSKAAPPAIIGADERDKFSVLREPWGEKLAKQMTLVLGPDMVRREEGSFNYLVRKDDKAKLQLAMDKASKATGLMKARREPDEKIKAFEDIVYWELSNIINEMEKREDREDSYGRGVKELLFLGAAFGIVAPLFQRLLDWGINRFRGRHEATLSARREVFKMLDGGVASEALSSVRTGLEISGDMKYGDAARLIKAREGLDAARKALEALERAREDLSKGRKR